jgi:hypothetical protein
MKLPRACDRDSTHKFQSAHTRGEISAGVKAGITRLVGKAQWRLLTLSVLFVKIVSLPLTMTAKNFTPFVDLSSAFFPSSLFPSIRVLPAYRRKRHS